MRLLLAVTTGHFHQGQDSGTVGSVLDLGPAAVRPFREHGKSAAAIRIRTIGGDGTSRAARSTGP